MFMEVEAKELIMTLSEEAMSYLEEHIPELAAVCLSAKMVI